jgi:glycosyltransferase involved in cell wall biosynthesis
VKNYAWHFLLCRRGAVAEILTIDPFAVDFYNKVLLTHKYRYLPDYIDRISPYPNGRQYLGLPDNRLIFCFLGVLDGRKGAMQFVTAMERVLQHSREIRDAAAFVFAGMVADEVRTLFYETLSRLRIHYPETPVILVDRFVSEQEFVTYIAASDVICIPYPQHTGLSSLLLHASAHGKPVIGPEFGTVGELIRRYRLGINCDPTNIASLADAIEAMRYRVSSIDEAEKSRLRGLFADRSLENFGDCMVQSVERALHR